MTTTECRHCRDLEAQLWQLTYVVRELARRLDQPGLAQLLDEAEEDEDEGEGGEEAAEAEGTP